MAKSDKSSPHLWRHPGVVALMFLVAASSLALTAAGRRKAASASVPAPSAKTTVEESPSRLLHLGGQTGLEMSAESLKLAGVTTVAAQAQEIQQTVEPTGEVAATDNDTVQITPRLPGRITQALVSVGTQVRKGQLIASVDSVDLAQAETAYQTAVQHLQLMQHQLEQQRKLAQFGSLSEQPVEDAKKAFAAAQAAVASDEAQINVDKTALENTRQLIDMGEITHKPVEDARNAYAQAQSGLTQAKVTLQAAKANLDRAKTLFDGGVFAKQQLQDAQTAYDTAAAAVQQSTAQENLADQELRRQESICKRNLNGTSSLQPAQAKLQQDEHTYQNDLTALELARKQLARAEAVRKSGIPVSQSLQQAEDAVQEAKAAVEGAENTLRLYGVTSGQASGGLQGGRAIIPVTSPITGIVTARSMVVGQMADTATPLVKVVNLDRVYVNAQVFEKDLSSIAIGDPIQVRVAAFPQKLFAGRVDDIGKEVSSDTRTITVRTVIRNPGWLLRPGMFATVLIGNHTGKRTLMIPADALVQKAKGQVVYVQVAPRQFAQRTVEVGPAVNGKVPVSSGLLAGDEIVVGGSVLVDHELEKLQEERSAP